MTSVGGCSGTAVVERWSTVLSSTHGLSSALEEDVVPLLSGLRDLEAILA